MTRTDQQIMDRELGNCDKCEIKLELKNLDNIGKRAARDKARFKKNH
jgi:hypothetical protein